MLSRFFEMQKFLYRNRLEFEKNRTSKLVHSSVGFSTRPLGCERSAGYLLDIGSVIKRGYYYAMLEMRRNRGGKRQDSEEGCLSPLRV